jgi:hypothetical protein
MTSTTPTTAEATLAAIPSEAELVRRLQEAREAARAAQQLIGIRRRLEAITGKSMTSTDLSPARTDCHD